MLPSGHIATGVLLGLRPHRRAPARARSWVLLGAVVSACLPDADLALPFVLDRMGIKHRLNSGRHHSWITHTPLFWAAVIALARRAGRHPLAPAWAPHAAGLLSVGVTLHLAEDALANTIALLWPVRRREYGLGLDHMPGVDDHIDYVLRYPTTPAGRLELALIAVAASALSRQRRLSRQPRSNGRRQAFGATS
ncbi:MAG TPA: metal-dependent hydrolase [Solirubrobacteraceae bacterium]|nr:metal-dependent hydrolase [Solirubrobacteraceae bacterium]